MTTAKAPRGGAGRGQGRKPLDPNAETIGVTIKMSTGQRDKLIVLGGKAGGPAWVRDRINKAKLPKE